MQPSLMGSGMSNRRTHDQERFDMTRIEKNWEHRTKKGKVPGTHTLGSQYGAAAPNSFPIFETLEPVAPEPISLSEALDAVVRIVMARLRLGVEAVARG